MSDELESAGKGGGLVIGGGLLVWLLTKLFKPSEDAAIRQAKLEERFDNTKEKLEERINGVAASQSIRISTLEIQVAKLQETITFLKERLAVYEEKEASEGELK